MGGQGHCLLLEEKKKNIIKDFTYMIFVASAETCLILVVMCQANYFVEEVRDKSGQDIDISSWEKEHVEDLPTQKNGCVFFKDYLIILILHELLHKQITYGVLELPVSGTYFRHGSGDMIFQGPFKYMKKIKKN